MGWASISNNPLGLLRLPGGAARIGFSDPVAPAYLKTVSDIINGEEVSAFRFLSAARVADVQARSLALDLTTPLADALAAGARLFLPRGSYKFTTLSFAAGGLRGEGAGLSRLVSSDATSANLITYTGTSGAAAVPHFSDFHIEAANTKAAGAGLAFIPSSVELQYAKIRGISVYNVPRSVSLSACTYGSITECTLLNYTDAGIYYENHYEYGAGDFAIANNHLGTGQATGNRYGIYQESGGGLRILGNKILGGLRGFALGYTGAVGSGPLLIVGNSIENCVNEAIYFGANAAGNFGGIVVSGNEIAICGSGIGTDANGKIYRLQIGENYIELASGSGTCIALNNIADFNIGPNTLVGGGGTPTGITIVSTCSNGKIAPQTYKNLTTKMAQNSTTVYAQGTLQTGTVTPITHTTAFGALFHGTAAVVFPTPFATVPRVRCNAGGGAGVAGGFAGYATSITTTGFTYNLAATVSGSTNSNSWEAEGVY